jgi:uncharacterized membrane protein YfcA
MIMKTALFLALAAITIWYVCMWIVLARKARTLGDKQGTDHTWYHALAGVVFGFLDTLGIGNFAPTTSAFKLRGSLPDEQIPGTLNVGYAVPTIVQAFIFISLVEVGVWTLTLMVAASVLGAWLGAGVVCHWSRRMIQRGMGLALLAAAGLMAMKQLDIGPPGGDALELGGVALWVGVAGNFVLGALMTLGIGLYAPCLILVSLLGMNPRAAFPIMMGSCAFLMPVGGVRFIRSGSYSLSTALTLTCAALPAVVIAVFLVGEMSLEAMRWLVIVVVVYTAAMMLRSGFSSPEEPATKMVAAPGALEQKGEGVRELR